jgi:hypothetical protein
MKEQEMVKELREFFKSPAGQFFEELDIKVMDITNRLRALETPDRSENRCFEPFTNRNVITPCGNTLGWHNRTDVHHPFNESIEDAIDAILIRELEGRRRNEQAG